MNAGLREIYSSADVGHEDWDEFDRTMKQQRRTAVFVAPQKVVAEPPLDIRHQCLAY